MTRAARFLAAIVLAALAASVLGGCATVHPWDRDLLAEPAMSFNPDPMLSAIDAHIYFSTEGSTGGQEVDGGGCGCN
jgi:Domain of unknown function (DUF4266)